MELRNKIIDIYGHSFWVGFWHKQKEEIEFKDTDGEWKPLPKIRTTHDLADFR